jgi:serine protease 16
MLVLEHRYYGESQPFNNWKTENLKYLTVNNALADIAYFLTWINEDLIERYGGEKRKTIVIGGSYPGALAAWFRYKYPHIADGALASSAVIWADEDMFSYDK